MPGYLRAALEQTARDVARDLLEEARFHVIAVEAQLAEGARLGVEDCVGRCGLALQEIGRRELAFRKAAVALLEDALAGDAGVRS